MTWPHATDYNAAVQNPRLCFRDEDLRQGQAVGDLFGLPRPHSGNFADVYQIQAPGGQSWAVKCFTRSVSGLRHRYHAVSAHLRQIQRAFMVDFQFLDEGICIRGEWHPLVKMRWIEGLRLNDFVREHLNKPVILERLAQMWVRLAQELRDAGMAHGDLQHGNVLLVPGSKSSSMALKLIDYDGMFVPALAPCPSGEVGHANYQHPRRLREGGYDGNMDRFAHLLIYTALHCLRQGGEELWQRYDTQENLLFREEDFPQPRKSPLIHELWDISDRDVHHLVGHLLLASQGPLRVVPMLDELVSDGAVRPLSDGEEARINDLLDDDDAPSRDRERAAVSAARFRSRLRPKAQAAVLAADTVVDNLVALTDTRPIPLDPTMPMPPPSEELDTQPLVGSTAARPSLDVAALADPLVALLSRPAWLVTLGVIALISFFVVNVLVWSTVKQPPPPVPRPTLADMDDVELHAGHKTALPCTIHRRDFSRPLTLRLEGLPGEIEAPPLTLPADKYTGSWILLPPLGIRPLQCEVRASLWDGEDKIDEKTFHLSIHSLPRSLPTAPDNTGRAASSPPSAPKLPPPRPQQKQKPDLRITGKTPQVMKVEAGKSIAWPIVLERGRYQDAVTIRLDGLPPGVNAAPITVPAGLSAASVMVETQADVPLGEHDLKLRVRIKDQTIAERDIALSIQRPRGRQETVHFPTVDHLELTGTLYHGWKGKKGMTVLMLHDLGRDRKASGWKRLAEAIQAEGHTVLTFDFRGHGDSKKVTAAFWKYTVNTYLPTHESGLPPDNQPRVLEAVDLPREYRPWLIEDIAAARTYLDVRHDEAEGPVNTFNLVILGAGESAALGSLWLATEGVRYNAADVGNKIRLKWPEKQSVLQAVWLGMADPLKLSPFGIHNWLRGAAAKPAVPIDFVIGEDDIDTGTLLAYPLREKYGKPFVLPGASQSGQELLDNNGKAAEKIKQYLVKTLQGLPPQDWVPRRIKSLHSYWAIPLPKMPNGKEQMRFYVAKRVGEETLMPLPFHALLIPLKGLMEPSSFVTTKPGP